MQKESSIKVLMVFKDRLRRRLERKVIECYHKEIGALIKLSGAMRKYHTQNESNLLKQNEKRVEVTAG